jgi:hypothetical protein
MTTVNRLHRLCGWSAKGTIAALTLMYCVSAFADPSKNVIPLADHGATHKHIKKVCYRYISGSATPQPCDRLGPIPTTAGAMDVFGRATGDEVRR